MTDSLGSLHDDALQRVLHVARLLGASADLREILQVIIDAMRDTLAAERATVFLYDPATAELYTTVAHGIGGAAGSKGTDASPGANPGSHPGAEPPEQRQIRFPVTHGIAGEAARTRRIINVPDAYADSRFNQEVDRRTGFRTRSILSIPLVDVDGDMVGVAQVLNKRGGGFTDFDENLAAALASQAGVAIKRGRLIEAQIKRQKLERDLQLARQIQQKTLPTAVPKLSGFDVAAWNEPAEETGGDTYDIIGLPAEGQGLISGDHDHAVRMLLMIADATGHGVGPALMAASVRAMTRMAARVGTTLRDIVEHLNHQICQDSLDNRFVTSWLGMVDSRDGTLTSFSAGQAPLVLFKAAGRAFIVMEADEMPFGIIDDWAFTAPTPITLEPGDFFAVFSDGFYEAADRSGKLLGIERVKELLLASRDKPAAAMIAHVREAMLKFIDGQPQADDCTAVIIKRQNA